MDSESNLLSHLIELRKRLMRSIMGLFCVLVVLLIYPGSNRIYDFIAAPMLKTLPMGHKMIAIGIITPFMVPLKITLLVAFLIALPWIMYQVWAFIAPGLYEHEKRKVVPLVIGSTSLFYLGMAFCYFVVFGVVFGFISRIVPDSINFLPDIQHYISFVLTMLMAFGITFQVPIAIIILVWSGFVSLDAIKQQRPYLIVAAFVIAAVVTPPDVMSQLMLALPLIVLYEIGLLVARLVQPPPATPDPAQEQDKPSA